MGISRKYLDEVREKALNNPLILDKENIRKSPFRGKLSESWIPADCWHEKFLILDIEGEYQENPECTLRRSISPEMFDTWLKNNYQKCYRLIQWKEKEKSPTLEEVIREKRIALGHPIT